MSRLPGASRDWFRCARHRRGCRRRCRVGDFAGIDRVTADAIATCGCSGHSSHDFGSPHAGRHDAHGYGSGRSGGPESTPAAKATPAPTRTPRPTRTPSPQITYAACDDVPTYLLRLDTQGRVAVERALVPSQPDGDSDGFACGDQLEHKRSWVASLTPAPSASVQATTTPRTPTAKTAQAAPTSVECLTPSEAAYLVAYGEQLLVIASTFEEMQPLFDDPRVFFDTDAQVVFVVGAALVQAAAQNIIDLEPPASSAFRLLMPQPSVWPSASFLRWTRLHRV